MPAKMYRKGNFTFTARFDAIGRKRKSGKTATKEFTLRTYKPMTRKEITDLARKMAEEEIGKINEYHKKGSVMYGDIRGLSFTSLEEKEM